jgi:hypothetical protein
MKRLAAVLFLTLAATLGTGGAQTALAAPPAGLVGQAPSEVFATNNTAIITNPNDPRLNTRLVEFAHQVRAIVRQGGGEPEDTTLLQGVFWDATLQQTTYEASREFDVDDVSPTRLHSIAEVIRTQFHQDSVLTFRFLPRTSPQADSIEVEVPGLDVRRLHDALVANPTARDHLGGGSVTTRGLLILVADRTDFELVHQLVVAMGGNWASRNVRFGAKEFAS